MASFDYLIAIGVSLIFSAVSITVVVIIVVIAVPALITSAVVPSVDTVKWRNDAAT